MYTCVCVPYHWLKLYNIYLYKPLTYQCAALGYLKGYDYMQIETRVGPVVVYTITPKF